MCSSCSDNAQQQKVAAEKTIKDIEKAILDHVEHTNCYTILEIMENCTRMEQGFKPKWNGVLNGLEQGLNPNGTGFKNRMEQAFKNKATKTSWLASIALKLCFFVLLSLYVHVVPSTCGGVTVAVVMQ